MSKFKKFGNVSLHLANTGWSLYDTNSETFLKASQSTAHVMNPVGHFSS